MKNKTTAGVLALALGSLGAHRFYLGQTKWGILYFVFCWTYIPMLIGFIDGLLFLIRSDADFDGKYNPQEFAPNPVYTPKVSPQYVKPTVALTPTLTVTVNNKTFQVESPFYNRITRDYEFYNNFKTYYGNYDYISPNEASRRVERMRQSSRSWDNDKYHDLQNRAFSPTDKERLAKIASLEGEELRAYSNSIFNDDLDYVTSVMMEAIFEKLSVHDEPLLLEELESLQPSQITMWVREKKQSGYFFTEAVYGAAWEVKKNKALKQS